MLHFFITFFELAWLPPSASLTQAQPTLASKNVNP